jgi:hypothetical protein
LIHGGDPNNKRHCKQNKSDNWNMDDSCAPYIYNGQPDVPRDVKFVKIASNVKEIQPRALFDCDELIDVDFTDATQLKTIGVEAFAYCLSLTTLKLSPNIEVIQQKAFAGCAQLIELHLNEHLELVENCAFANCTSLKKVMIPSSSRLNRIGTCSFLYCESLLHLSLPSSLTKDRIGLNALYRCKKLNGVDWDTWNYDGSEKFIPHDVKHFRVEAGVTEIPCFSFREFSFLKSITFNDGLKKICERTFERCYELKKVTLPSTVTSCERAFNTDYIESIDMQGNNNLLLALRLKVLYPNATPKITMDRMIFMYSYPQWIISMHYPLLGPDDDDQEAETMLQEIQDDEQDAEAKLNEIRVEYVEAIRRLVAWCAGKGILSGPQKARVNDEKLYLESQEENESLKKRKVENCEEEIQSFKSEVNPR